MTRGVSRGILWIPPGTGLKRINDEFGLGIKFHDTFLEATFPNGSMITLRGADTHGEIDKMRGVPYDLVIIDESKSFPTSLLTELVEEVLEPTMNDRMGTVVIMGTPGCILQGVFYEATKKGSTIARPYQGRDWWSGPFEWSAHSWDIQDNVAMPHLWDAAKARKVKRGWSDDNPIWRREYRGEWLADDSALVYKYFSDRNDWKPDPDSEAPFGLPEGHEWRFLLGLDLGFDDDFALVIAAYSDTHPEMFQVFDYSEPHLIISDIVHKIREAEEMCGEFDVMVGDRGGLGKMIFEELAQTYGIHIEAADKQEKRTYIELLNSDLMEARIRILEGSKLSMEMGFLQWDETGLKEDKACPNHACDAFLYLWRYSYHHFFEDRAQTPEPGTREYSLMVQQEMLERAREEKRRKREFDDWEDNVILDPDTPDGVDWFEDFRDF